MGDLTLQTQPSGAMGTRRTAQLLGALAAALLAVQAVAAVGIRADTNRDGVVDVRGESDAAGRAEWTAERGAIILPNIGDERRRCPRSGDRSKTDAQLEACHDAADNVARAPGYLAPLRTLPMPAAMAGDVGTVRAVGRGAEKIRLFVRRGNQWVYLGDTGRLTLRELRFGAHLGVDSRDVVRNSAAWDGRAMIELSVTSRGVVETDRVAVRVAPVLIHHHAQRALQVFVPRSGGLREHEKFVLDLSLAIRSTAMLRPPVRLNTTDTWAQDFVEFGHVSMPGPTGRPITLRLAIRSPQPGRSGGRAVFDLRGPGMGAIQTGGAGYHQVDSFGNLETVPPHEFNGRKYPAGRIIYGDAQDGLAPHPDMRAFFAAQEVQAPIVLDTSWLAIGHVDEFVQFLPARTPRGWKIAVVDVDQALDILKRAQSQGHGAAPAYSYTGPDAPKTTLNELLADQAFLQANALAAGKIRENIDVLKRETGVTDDEIIGIPGLFQAAAFPGTGPAPASTQRQAAPPPPPLEPIVYGPGTLIAAHPAAINGVVLTARRIVAPRTWGPRIQGQDILQTAVEAAYAKAGMQVSFIDDWSSHHEFGGEVHCGSNTLRAIGAPWWQ